MHRKPSHQGCHISRDVSLDERTERPYCFYSMPCSSEEISAQNTVQATRACFNAVWQTIPFLLPVDLSTHSTTEYYCSRSTSGPCQSKWKLKKITPSSQKGTRDKCRDLKQNGFRPSPSFLHFNVSFSAPPTPSAHLLL